MTVTREQYLRMAENAEKHGKHKVKMHTPHQSLGKDFGAYFQQDDFSYLVGD